MARLNLGAIERSLVRNTSKSANSFDSRKSTILAVVGFVVFTLVAMLGTAAWRTQQPVARIKLTDTTLHIGAVDQRLLTITDTRVVDNCTLVISTSKKETFIDFKPQDAAAVKWLASEILHRVGHAKRLHQQRIADERNSEATADEHNSEATADEHNSEATADEHRSEAPADEHGSEATADEHRSVNDPILAGLTLSLDAVSGQIACDPATNRRALLRYRLHWVAIIGLLVSVVAVVAGAWWIPFQGEVPPFELVLKAGILVLLGFIPAYLYGSEIGSWASYASRQRPVTTPFSLTPTTLQIGTSHSSRGKHVPYRDTKFASNHRSEWWRRRT